MEVIRSAANALDLAKGLGHELNTWILKEGKPVSVFSEIHEMRRDFLRAVYERRNDNTAGIVNGRVVAKAVGIPFESPSFHGLASDLDGQGWIKRQADKYGMIGITPAGIAAVEGTQEKTPAGASAFNIHSPQASIIGMQQNAELTATFNFEDLDRDITQRGEDQDQERLVEIRDLLLEMLQTQRTVQRGALEKYGDLLRKYSWLIEHASRALVGYVTQTGVPQ